MTQPTGGDATQPAPTVPAQPNPGHTDNNNQNDTPGSDGKQDDAVDKSKGWWEKAWDKWKDFKDWASELFGAKEHNEPPGHTQQ